MGCRLLLGVTGGIAAYKSPLLIRLFQKNGIEVKVVATQHAFEFVTRVTLEALTCSPVYCEMFDERNSIEHINLASWADMFVVAPATANTIAKFANGVADNLLSTTYITVKCPVLVAPSMNNAMYIDATTQHNLKILRSRGVHVCEPGIGWLACGAEGPGRMAEPEEIFEQAKLLVRDQTALAGKKILVTAGATRERIDPVRFISNRSSGKMGFAIADMLQRYGADVTLISGASSLMPPFDVKFVPVESAAQMNDAVMSCAADMDVIIKAAAVADYTPVAVSESKIKKSSDGAGLTIELTRTQDILANLAAAKQPGQLLIGFAAETNDHIKNAVGKLARKKLDMIVLNDVRATDAGFASDNNRVMFVRPAKAAAEPESWETKEVDGTRIAMKATPLMSKLAIADELARIIADMLTSK